MRYAYCAFQSTRPYGARLVFGAVDLLSECFNPRARMGRDVHASALDAHLRVSIHAPVWGATVRNEADILSRWFQSTRPYGARQILPGNIAQAVGFNPRARMGRDARRAMLI